MRAKRETIDEAAGSAWAHLNPDTHWTTARDLERVMDLVGLGDGK